MSPGEAFFIFVIYQTFDLRAQIWSSLQLRQFHIPNVLQKLKQVEKVFFFYQKLIKYVQIYIHTRGMSTESVHPSQLHTEQDKR